MCLTYVYRLMAAQLCYERHALEMSTESLIYCLTERLISTRAMRWVFPCTSVSVAAAACTFDSVYVEINDLHKMDWSYRRRSSERTWGYKAKPSKNGDSLTHWLTAGSRNVLQGITTELNHAHWIGRPASGRHCVYEGANVITKYI